MGRMHRNSEERKYNAINEAIFIKIWVMEKW
jgi:hypothetical protein